MLPVRVQRACAVYYLCKSGPLSLYVVTVAKTPLSEEEGERGREREREKQLWGMVHLWKIKLCGIIM